MADRLYIVTPNAGASRLIRATNRAQAIAHAARTTFVAAVAEPEDCFDLARKGVEIEVAGELATDTAEA